MTKDTKRQWVNKHPLEIIEDILTDAGVPSSLIDATSFAPATYSTTFSHRVVDSSNIYRGGSEALPSEDSA